MLRCCYTWARGKGLRLVRGRPGEESGWRIHAATTAVVAAADIAVVAGIVKMGGLFVAAQESKAEGGKGGREGVTQ